MEILTPRERDVAMLTSKARSNKEIGHELGLTEGTVKVYLSRIFAKLGFSACGNSRMRLALYVLGSRYE